MADKPLPLPRKQADELARIAEADRPATSSTLLAWPLQYHGLIRNTKRDGYPAWEITARGRQWLAAAAARKAKRKSK